MKGQPKVSPEEGQEPSEKNISGAVGHFSGIESGKKKKASPLGGKRSGRIKTHQKK